MYAHTPGKGWWFKQVQVTVSGSAPTVSVAHSVVTGKENLVTLGFSVTESS